MKAFLQILWMDRSFCQFSKNIFQAGDAQFMFLAESHIVGLEKDNEWTNGRQS